MASDPSAGQVKRTGRKGKQPLSFNKIKRKTRGARRKK